MWKAAQNHKWIENLPRLDTLVSETWNAICDTCTWRKMHVESCQSSEPHLCVSSSSSTMSYSMLKTHTASAWQATADGPVWKRERLPPTMTCRRGVQRFRSTSPISWVKLIFMEIFCKHLFFIVWWNSALKSPKVLSAHGIFRSDG